MDNKKWQFILRLLQHTRNPCSSNIYANFIPIPLLSVPGLLLICAAVPLIGIIIYHRRLLSFGNHYEAQRRISYFIMGQKVLLPGEREGLSGQAASPFVWRAHFTCPRTSTTDHHRAGTVTEMRNRRTVNHLGGLTLGNLCRNAAMILFLFEMSPFADCQPNNDQREWKRQTNSFSVSGQGPEERRTFQSRWIKWDRQVVVN